MSPVVDRGLVIAHVGGHDDGALIAFDARTGEVMWRWTGDGPAYASPIVVELGGVRQVVTETQNNIAAVSAASGKLLWEIPFTTEYVQNIPTPLFDHDLLILCGPLEGNHGDSRRPEGGQVVRRNRLAQYRSRNLYELPGGGW